MVRIGGLWKNTDKAGDVYLAGNFGHGRIIVLPNKHKSNEREPDYVMYIRDKEDQNVQDL